MTKNRTSKMSADQVKKIRALREQDERNFLAHAFDYFRENAISGDVHEYGCDRRPVLPSVIAAGESYPVTRMKYFGFASFTEPRVVPGRAPKTESDLDVFVSQKELQKSTAGKVTFVVGPTATILGKAERDRFMNTENKVALAIIHGAAGNDAKAALEFVEPLLTEGSLIYFVDLFAGYRRTGAKEVGRSFLEFQQNCRFRYLRFMDIGWWGRSYAACLPVDLPFEKL